MFWEAPWIERYFVSSLLPSVSHSRCSYPANTWTGVRCDNSLIDDPFRSMERLIATWECLSTRKTKRRYPSHLKWKEKCLSLGKRQLFSANKLQGGFVAALINWWRWNNQCSGIYATAKHCNWQFAVKIHQPLQSAVINEVTVPDSTLRRGPLWEKRKNKFARMLSLKRFGTGCI